MPLSNAARAGMKKALATPLKQPIALLKNSGREVAAKVVQAMRPKGIGTVLFGNAAGGAAPNAGAASGTETDETDTSSPAPATPAAEEVHQPTPAGGGGRGGGGGKRDKRTEEKKGGAEEEEEEEEVVELTETWVDRNKKTGERWWGVKWLNGEITAQLDTNLPSSAQFLALRRKVLPGYRYNDASAVALPRKRRSPSLTRKKKRKGGGPPPPGVEPTLPDLHAIVESVETHTAEQKREPMAWLNTWVQWSPAPPITLLPTCQCKHIELRKSMCLIDTIRSLVGKFVDIDMGVLNKLILGRKEVAHSQGWHSIQQLNAYLEHTSSEIVLCRVSCVPRGEREFTRNVFLQNQKTGLFVLQCSVANIRTGGQLYQHFVGVDFYTQEIIDTLVQTRRTLCSAEWELLGLRDWQGAFAICVR